MSLGESLIWITSLILFLTGVRYINNKKKWRLVFKIGGGLILLLIMISLIAWGWSVYKERPQPVDTLGAISLGMTPVEVTLALGKPDNANTDDVSDGKRRYLYIDYGILNYFIRFSNEAGSVEHVEAVCSGGYNTILGLSKYSSESDVIKKLGDPISKSISKDGLRKMISYPKWKVSFEIEKGNVINVCVSEDGKMQYIEEYKDNLAV